MATEIYIGISIVAVLAVLFGIKTYLYSLVKFKMDESAILKCFNEANDGRIFRDTEEIAAATEIDATRVSQVCLKSKAIEANTEEKESWCARQAQNP